MLHIPITAGWFLALLCVIAVALVAGTVLAFRRSRAWTSWLAGGVSLLVVVVTVAALVNANYSYYQWLDDLTSERTWPDGVGKGPHPDGGVLSTPIPGKVSGVTAGDAMVYLPPQYWSEPKRAFPVVYLVPGTPGAPDDLFRAGRASDAGLAAAESGAPVILVAPSVGPDWTSDTECVNGAQGQWDTYVSVDVVAAVDHNLRTIRQRGARAIGGLSMGGYCALNLGLRHRDTYSTIIDLSGETGPSFDAGMAALFGSVPDLTTVVNANTPRSYVPNLPKQPFERIWLDCGSDDDTGPLEDLADMAPMLSARGFDVVVKSRPGGHEWSVWRTALTESIPWAAAAVTAGSSAGPPA